MRSACTVVEENKKRKCAIKETEKKQQIHNMLSTIAMKLRSNI